MSKTVTISDKSHRNIALKACVLKDASVVKARLEQVRDEKTL